MCLFLAVRRVGLWSVVVVFPGHIHLFVCQFYEFSLSFTIKVVPSATLNAADKLELIDKAIFLSCFKQYRQQY